MSSPPGILPPFPIRTLALSRCAFSCHDPFIILYLSRTTLTPNPYAVIAICTDILSLPSCLALSNRCSTTYLYLDSLLVPSMACRSLFVIPPHPPCSVFGAIPGSLFSLVLGLLSMHIARLVIVVFASPVVSYLPFLPLCFRELWWWTFFGGVSCCR